MNTDTTLVKDKYQEFAEKIAIQIRDWSEDNAVPFEARKVLMTLIELELD